jgi:hypothetical protein
VNQTPVNLGHEFGGYKASDVAECVLWPVFFHGHDCNRKKSFSPQGHRDTEKAGEREKEKKTTEVFLCDSVLKSSWMFAMTIKFDNFFPGVENSGDA